MAELKENLAKGPVPVEAPKTYSNLRPAEFEEEEEEDEDEETEMYPKQSRRGFSPRYDLKKKRNVDFTSLKETLAENKM